ncbi:MAG TPA: DUF5677 domain-containing protein [Candidatus Polarisedimenticolia bacterium]|jgi:hypothetical protein|nr:DUF5677 domain-containing protein [Candidatus Polarisedimenticolia bacterium]
MDDKEWHEFVTERGLNYEAIEYVRRLNRRLMKASIALEEALHAEPMSSTVNGRIIVSLYRKAVKTFRAIELLKEQDLIEESWILLRALLETHVNLIYFLQNDAKEMSRRFVDWMSLDLVRRARDAEYFRGIPLPEKVEKEEFERTEAEIRSRYTVAEFDSIKKKGFTGLSFEKRSEAVGFNADTYAYYRVSSRNLHTLDPVDYPALWRDIPEDGRMTELLLRSRLLELETNQNMLLGKLSLILNGSVFKNGSIGAELREIETAFMAGPPRGSEEK